MSSATRRIIGAGFAGVACARMLPPAGLDAEDVLAFSLEQSYPAGAA